MRKTLLAVLAHPDDESFGVGGTLARYAAEGVDVHIAIATDGVAGSVARGYEHTLADLVTIRTQELEAAVNILGGRLHLLGFQDSGYIGDPANKLPEAFINIDKEISIGRLVSLIRTIKPQVILTHDESGGYFHPDHIHCCTITTEAFTAAGDEEKYPHFGPPFQSQRLFYSAFPNHMVKIFAFLLRLRGKNPKKIGRNEDIDLTKLGIPSQRLHAKIDYRNFWDVKRRASAEHRSQGGGTSNSRSLPEWFQRRFLAHEYFIRAIPSAADGYRINDLFEGVKIESFEIDET
ncbi:MAG: PIG-L deacetylase family protein [Candidatus Promineifilaceae bacterium]|nr:PIG-L deacetylase family protein [Candidatus Promineifilaceae bacterium]